MNEPETIDDQGHVIRSQTASKKSLNISAIQTNKVIKSQSLPQKGKRKIVIGGDNIEQTHEDAPPNIILEKDEDGQICRIIVKCTCGKHAELTCHYE